MFKKKKNLDLVKKMAESIKENVLNRSLYAYILQCLNYSLEDNYVVINTNNSSIIIREKKSSNSIKISFIPSVESIDSICIDEATWNGACERKTVISFSDEIICVDKDEIIRYTSEKTKEVCSIKKHSTKQTYINNDLRYSYKFSNQIYFSLNPNQSYTTFEETYIDENKNAYKCENIIIDEAKFCSNVTTYYYTDYYDEPPFNDRINNKGIYKYVMKISTQEPFNEFVKVQKDVLKKRLEK